MGSSPAPAQLVENEIRKWDRRFRLRRNFDFAYAYLRSCAVCTSFLPPIDLLCESCWVRFSKIANRGKGLYQPDYPFPVYSLLTWTPETDHFVKPFIYGFKGGRAVRAGEKLATLFLSERGLSPGEGVLTAAPGESLDHSALWARVLANSFRMPALRPYRDVGLIKVGQKRLNQTERAERRFEVRELFADTFPRQPASDSDPRPQSVCAKRILFADDVITSGATAMAAYMALGDPEHFEVWTLAARPRLAGKSSVCYSPATP